jgi:HPt (histidine-containing phosphotransfer) domain-containing protein
MGNRVQRLRELHESNQLIELQRCVHTIRGSACNFGAQRMATLAERLELGIEGDREVRRNLVVALAAEYQQVRALLKAKVLCEGSAPPVQEPEAVTQE